ncbi:MULTISPECIES: GntR family transcriptional regulator [Rhizobium/Agrobacterium group]|jgi:DNA-binding GntR family transcriptional regulator|uniref:GntR family transcriptional regulator n=2 Tax=Rhizobium/Agrobacterium group TaxID=227290 RepID=A0AA92C2D9_RHIRH|nr:MULTISPECIES: GntR family transcriptional regulator [Rhizobium/Agrobacterium group]KQM32344.1 GntR family transcriptional regulator [Rhizobium sp. Leaf202]KQN84140.1 GntR family transcriptional regulator [Rhizobium sp. Leaf68]KQR35833.1 GntR family transcriptional regulator [Rhizobium sp. Leaf155]KQZ95072.1 GntR family transcriptional regulator [Rhizobium sp. Root564]MQB22543.1 GntR family transcriptional regulator [Agrobacterium tumefaciens]PVE71875.1 GntR family transcriptional regulator
MSTNLTRSDAIYASLRRAILEQALKPGTKLPEDSIGDTFGVSRTSARNALVRLSSDGLVEIKPNRGAAVAMPTLEEAVEVFALRRCLEREVIDRLCKRMPKDGIDALVSHVREEERALRASSPRSIRLAGEFHILLAELTGSKLLIEFIIQVVSRSSLILARFGRPHSAECGIDEHIQLIEALKNLDVKAATDIMDHHLHAVEDRAKADDEDDGPDISEILSRYISASE